MIPDVYDDPRVPLEAYRATFVRSLAMVPIATDEPVGAIGAYWASAHIATAAELDTLTTLADAASLALANVKLYEELRGALAREREARRVAEAATEAKDLFLAMVSHELRQPLQAILAAADLMSTRASREKGVRAREIVQRQVRAMWRMVDDLLDASRIVRGEVDIRREHVEVRAVLHEAIEVSMPSELGRRVVQNLPPDPVWVFADPFRLRQVFQNLLANAVKYSPAHTTVDVRLVADGADAVITIRDCGVGIGSAVLPHLFELFTRGTDTVPGFGVGLAVVRRLVELHGGQVTAHSEGEGRGSEFVVRLPLAEHSVVA